MKKKPQQLKMEYLGIKNPETFDEIEFEIAGLETLIAEAKLKIAALKQGQALAKIINSEITNENNNSEKTK